MLNFAIAIWVVAEASRRFGEGRVVYAAAALLSVPLFYGLIVGQFTAFYVLFLFLSIRDFATGREGRAGVWLGLLVIKPQLAVGYGLALLVKCRWRALAGFVGSAAVLGAASLAILGRSGVEAFGASWRLFSGFRAVHPSVYPPEFANWHGLLVNLLPRAGERDGYLLTLALSLATMSAVPVIWRGPWRPNGPRFAAQMLATTAVTLLASFHGYIHGAALLVPPALAAMAEQATPIGMRRALAIGYVGVTFVFAVTGSLVLASMLATAAMAALVLAALPHHASGEGVVMS
jgi:hypothetical protein